MKRSLTSVTVAASSVMPKIHVLPNRSSSIIPQVSISMQQVRG